MREKSEASEHELNLVLADDAVVSFARVIMEQRRGSCWFWPFWWDLSSYEIITNCIEFMR
jgi:hypothetical protein